MREHITKNKDAGSTENRSKAHFEGSGIRTISMENNLNSLLLEAAEQMETLSLFADQAAWDSIVTRLKTAAHNCQED